MLFVPCSKLIAKFGRQTRLLTTIACCMVGCGLLGWTTVYAHDPIAEMTESAQRFVALLDEQQRQKCLHPAAGSARETWNFVPDRFIQPEPRRNGLPLTEMTSQQRLLTHALLTTALSNQGYRKTVSIMALEQVLFELESGNAIRNPDLYYLTVFGQPDSSGTWGWRFEGHHLSLNFTIREGKEVSLTPAFFGTNPAEVRQGALKGVRVLAAEEDLARKLVTSLTAAQQARAIPVTSVPGDILSMNESEITQELFADHQGIAYEDLLPEQQQLLLRIVNQYAAAFQQPLIEQVEQRKSLIAGEGLRFVWIGDTKVGAAHYYRILSPAYVFEYDNTQNDANHIHAVWRDFAGDFGRDLLRTHYQQQHR